eukprot:scaffold256071_cov32-Tisochrysis_lutea.AAC.4
MHLLEHYGRATGARVNTAKSVIIRIGALRKGAIPEHLATLKTLGEGEYATILGSFASYSPMGGARFIRCAASVRCEVEPPPSRLLQL